MQAEAVEGLNEYLDGLSTFLAEATNDALPASTVHHELQMHVDQLIQQTDAYAAGDYVRAFELERQSYAHMFPLGKTLAAGIVTGTGRAAGGLRQPRTPDAVALGMALGEHAELAVDAMRSGLAGQPDFTAAAALDTNTARSPASSRAFRREAATAFQALWADHIDAFVGTPRPWRPATRRSRPSRARLEQFNADFAAFLATQSRIVWAPALAVPSSSTRTSCCARSIVRARDYSTAHTLSFEAYQHMFALAAQLATAIGTPLPLAARRAACRRAKAGWQTSPRR